MRMMIAMILPMVLSGAVPLVAHDEIRVIGNITKHVDSTISVKDDKSKTRSVRLDKFTSITRDNQAVGASELKVGVRVVVDAGGDTEADLVAFEIRIVPSSALRE